MTGKLKLLAKKIESRITDGEMLEDIIASYDYLTQADIDVLMEWFQGQAQEPSSEPHNQA